MSKSAKEPVPREIAAADWLLRPETRAVLDALEQAGHAARVVGGAVRNALLGLPVADVDIATPASPAEVVAAVTQAGLVAHPTGIEHGTMTVVSQGVPFEVTTLRRDVATDGRRAIVAYTANWVEDAARRDFTINALYADAAGRVYDPLGSGLADLDARRVRFIGDPHQRIREDYLRILRFFRFSAAYSGGELDAESLAACDAERAGLGRLSAERVRAELLRLFESSPVALQRTVSAMHLHGYLAAVFGSAPSPGRFDRFLSIEQSCSCFDGNDPLARVAALVLHSSCDSSRLAKRLRLSNEERARIGAMAEGFASRRNEAPDLISRRRELYQRGGGRYRDWLLFSWLGGRAAASDVRFIEAVALPEHWSPPRLPVSGSDVIAVGVPSGPRTGKMLSEVERWWVATDFSADRAACLQEIARIAKQSQ